jgi:hypothetical protein
VNRLVCVPMRNAAVVPPILAPGFVGPLWVPLWALRVPPGVSVAVDFSVLRWVPKLSACVHSHAPWDSSSNAVGHRVSLFEVISVPAHKVKETWAVHVDTEVSAWAAPVFRRPTDKCVVRSATMQFPAQQTGIAFALEPENPCVSPQTTLET